MHPRSYFSSPRRRTEIAYQSELLGTKRKDEIVQCVTAYELRSLYPCRFHPSYFFSTPVTSKLAVFSQGESAAGVDLNVSDWRRRNRPIHSSIHVLSVPNGGHPERCEISIVSRLVRSFLNLSFCPSAIARIPYPLSMTSVRLSLSHHPRAPALVHPVRVWHDLHQ